MYKRVRRNHQTRPKILVFEIASKCSSERCKIPRGDFLLPRTGWDLNCNEQEPITQGSKGWKTIDE
jgi:hypothetical protein